MKKISILFVLLFVITINVSSEIFEFKYREGEKYRIVSTVDEQVFINDVFSHKADILNKISIEVTEVKKGAGFLKSQFQTSERAYGSDSVFTWGNDYVSSFWRDYRGVYNIDPSYYMPVVRNVPVFPDRDLNAGDTWAYKAEEVHDLRNNFGIEDAFHFPVNVSYKYLGKEELDGNLYHLISIKYSIFFKNTQHYNTGSVYPVRITGYSSQLLFWDNTAGRPYAYKEEFDIFFNLSSGDTVEYQGRAEARVTESASMDKEKIIKEIRRNIDDNKIENIDVKSSEKGVILTLENIQFLPNSAVLPASEKEKLNKIIDIIAAYPERDLLIAGHTAMAGTLQGRKILSEERARAVGDYLLSGKCRTEEQMIIKGMGGEHPIADNRTEKGMRKNRRVEITILEN